jgi:hypothetical protein
MACVLAEAERLYGAHGVAFFTLSCSLSDGKKAMRFPAKWQMLPQGEMRFANKNAVCVRTGTGAQTPLVVVDADGADAIAVVEQLLVRTGVDARLVPQVRTQRGESGRHYYFRAQGLAGTLKSGAKIVVDGAQTNVDVRAGSNGEGVGCVLAPPTKVLGGGEYTLLPGPPIHEAPAMPDELAEVLGARGRSLRAAPAPAATPDSTACATACASALCAVALRDARIRAGTESVGYPSRVVRVDDGARVEFTHRGTRVCPVSRNEHRSNHFSVVLRADERTGLPAFFVYCHSAKDGCKGAGHRMLGFLCADEASGLLGTTAREDDAPHRPTLAQAAVAIGEAQKALDRLLENPGGEWASVESLSVIACALCTAAGCHAGLTMTAQLMLDAILDSLALAGAERELVNRAFQVAKTPLDPVATLRGFAAGLNGKREQELMLIREAIVACTDPALDADVPAAAEAMMCVLEFCELRDETTGRVEKLGNITDMGLFVYFIWRRVARYGFDKTQSSESHQWTMYLFNGATYERGQWKALKDETKQHILRIIKLLCDAPALRARAKAAFARCHSSDYIARALSDAGECMQNPRRLAKCGLVSPDKFERELDMGNYIGFTNGVYDILNDRFLPMGHVPLNVLVSMSTNYAYVPPDDAHFEENRAQIEEFYRTLHAENYDNPNDERLAAMWLLSGSLLFRGNMCKKAFVFLGSEGDNGKSTFTELIQLTLGDYAVTGSRSSLSGPADQATLDPDLVANHKSLVCTFPEAQSVESGVSAGFKFNCGKLKALTGQDEQSARGLYRDKKCFVIGFKPIMHSNFMPQVDSDDAAARNRLWVARFGSTFPAGLTERDVSRRRFPRIENLRDQMATWAPYHFLLMLEALRDFRRRNCVLPPGAQQIEGSLMHQACVAQTPEGKLRAWVEEHYSHVPMREKDTGTKLDSLYTAYVAAAPPVHAKILGKIKLGRMLNAVYPNVGPHRTTTGAAEVYLLR